MTSVDACELDCWSFYRGKCSQDDRTPEAEGRQFHLAHDQLRGPLGVGSRSGEPTGSQKRVTLLA